MPIDPITWTIIGLSFFGGGAVGYFWDEITAWANRVVRYIIDTVNHAIEVTSDAIVYLVREGQRYYKLVEVYVMNVRTDEVRIESRKGEILKNQVPQEQDEELKRKASQKLKLMQYET